jgi:very-short-patch-repair endonuclease
MLPFNKKLKTPARELRKNMTEAERHLWSKIRRKQLQGYQFYRQKNIGNYIVDFYCPARKLVIEIDGGQHYTEAGKRKDRVRDSYLTALGLTVLRFSDTEVLKNTNSVLERIYKYMHSPILNSVS